VIASSGGGTEDLIESGGGIIVAPDNVDQCVSAILQITSTPLEWARRSQLARRLAEQTFNLPGYLAEWNTIYQSALGKVVINDT
jgi:glycosyltransferase involved in cell wall biosynthesis